MSTAARAFCEGFEYNDSNTVTDIESIKVIEFFNKMVGGGKPDNLLKKNMKSSADILDCLDISIASDENQNTTMVNTEVGGSSDNKDGAKATIEPSPVKDVLNRISKDLLNYTYPSSKDEVTFPKSPKNCNTTDLINDTIVDESQFCKTLEASKSLPNLIISTPKDKTFKDRITPTKSTRPLKRNLVTYFTDINSPDSDDDEKVRYLKEHDMFKDDSDPNDPSYVPEKDRVDVMSDSSVSNDSAGNKVISLNQSFSEPPSNPSILQDPYPRKSQGGSGGLGSVSENVERTASTKSARQPSHKRTGQQSTVRDFSTPIKKLKIVYDIKTPSPTIKEKTQANENFMRIISVLGHQIYFDKGETMEGKSLGIDLMRNVSERGLESGLLVKPLKPSSALYLYFKNEKRCKQWFRGHPETGFEKRVGNVRFHVNDKEYCPFGHCDMGRQMLKDKPNIHNAINGKNSTDPTGVDIEDDDVITTRYVEEADSENVYSATVSQTVEQGGLSMDDSVEGYELVPESLSLSQGEEINPAIFTDSTNRVCNEEKGLSCNFCSFATDRKFNFERHMLKCHRISKNVDYNKIKVKCEHCLKVVNKQNLQRHLKENRICMNMRQVTDQGLETIQSSQQVMMRNKDKRYSTCPHCHLLRRLDSHIDVCPANPVNSGSSKLRVPSQESDRTAHNRRNKRANASNLKNSSSKTHESNIDVESTSKVTMGKIPLPQHVRDLCQTAKRSEEPDVTEIMKEFIVAQADIMNNKKCTHISEITVSLDKEVSILRIKHNIGLGGEWLESLCAPNESLTAGKNAVFSMYAIVNKIEISTSSSDNVAYTWKSRGKKFFNFFESDCTKEGTEILLHLKEEISIGKKKIKSAIRYVKGLYNITIGFELVNNADDKRSSEALEVAAVEGEEGPLVESNQSFAKSEVSSHSSFPSTCLPVRKEGSTGKTSRCLTQDQTVIQDEDCREFSPSPESEIRTPYVSPKPLEPARPPPLGKPGWEQGLGEGPPSLDDVVEESLDLSMRMEAFKLSNDISPDEQDNLEDLLSEINKLDAEFPTEYDKMIQSTQGDETVKRFIYEYWCHNKCKIPQTKTPKVLPGIVKNYWNKFKLHILPIFRVKFRSFRGEWFFDIAGSYEKPGCKGIFIPTASFLQSLVLNSFSYLEYPAQSRKQLLQSIIFFLNGLLWFVGENEHSFKKISRANDFKNKISHTVTSLSPLYQPIANQVMEELAEKRVLSENDNPKRQEQVAAAIVNYVESNETEKLFRSIRCEYDKLMSNPKYVPTAAHMSEFTEGLITEFHISTPLRPKAIYDFSLHALLFRAQPGFKKSLKGVNIPITWDKTVDLGRYIHVEESLYIALKMFVLLRNVFFSHKPIPDGYENENWFLEKESPIFLTLNGNPFEKIVLKKLNEISKRDGIISEDTNLTPYDFRLENYYPLLIRKLAKLCTKSVQGCI